MWRGRRPFGLLPRLDTKRAAQPFGPSLSRAVASAVHLSALRVRTVILHFTILIAKIAILACQNFDMSKLAG